MPCYHPMPATRLDDGSVSFSANRSRGGDLTLPCGQCVGCRLERSRQWAVRCVHEASLYDVNSYVTLTYGDDPGVSLVYRDFQLFMKRLRRFFSPRVIRFYMCGEYGEEFSRPHFHAILFNCSFDDRVLFKTVNGFKLFRSPTLESLWSYGHSSIGEVTFESAAYVARYCMKKMTGHLAQDHYTDPETGEIREPEFNHMSLKPGIGAGWIDKWTSDVYPDGHCVVRGVKTMPPKYYDKRFSDRDPVSFEQVQFARALDGRARYLDSTDERLIVRETVAKARIRALKRTLK